MTTIRVESPTPWGHADHVEEIAEGITLVGTPSHGGFFLSNERLEQVDERYRDYAAQWSHGWGPNWFEEDCAALAVLVTFPEHFPHMHLGGSTEGPVVDPALVAKYKATLAHYMGDE